MLAVCAVLAGNYLDGGHLRALVSLPAMLIVLGGTVGAVMIQTPYRIFLGSISMLLWVVNRPSSIQEKEIKKLVELTIVSRKEGLIGLEDYIDKEKDLFLKQGIELLVEGHSPGKIRRIMELRLDAHEDRQLRHAKVYEAMGGYAPTIGIMGAVLGLIHVMQNLADPEKLGPGVATAFLATIYGVGLANLFFLPIGNRLKSVVFEISTRKEIIIEAVVSIAEGQNPRHVMAKLLAMSEES